MQTSQKLKITPPAKQNQADLLPKRYEKQHPRVCPRF